MQSGIWTSVESPQSWPQAQPNAAPVVFFNRAPSVSAPVILPTKETVAPSTSSSSWSQGWETSNVFKKAGAKLFGKSKSSKSSEVKSGEVAAQHVAVEVESPKKKALSLPPAPQVEELTEEEEQIEDELSRQNLYKTELCRSFQETGICRYGHKCQFAHGYAEIRPVMRHPKYKTEICKTFTNTGNCPYGNRCRFIHQGHSKGAPVVVEPTPVAKNGEWSTSWTQAQEPQKVKRILINHDVDDLLEGTRRLAVFQQLAN
eukprot:TRINITY_DN223_c0_g1_i1.p1 TRINITY_DN223_c0_g1~~TRINITY_DN223_c0_g1_i1.p1  ORF type:complete len:259 (-),score=81.34 TRINITY_DN223_c0_g1_i1:206-982(-)